MSRKPFEFITGEFYSNILMLSNSGKPLSTISNKRAKWYLSRGLAVEVQNRYGFGKVVQLNFSPKSEECFLPIANLENICVVCGASSNLSVHHVIPICIKREFPKERKEHTRHWCVLVCKKHHAKAEAACRPIYEKDMQKALGEAQNEIRLKYQSFHKFLGLSYGFGSERIPKPFLSEEEKNEIEILFNRGYFDFSKSELNACKIAIKQESATKVELAKKEWIQKFISEHNGIDNVAEIFKSKFLELNPKFVPEGYLSKI